MSVVQQALAAARPVDWPDPEPLATQDAPAPFPINVLPITMQKAVEEVQSFVQAPLPMVSGSALTALSLAAQPHANVRRASRLAGPVSLYMLAIALSGERKTTLDNYFLQPIRQWQAETKKAAAPELAEYEAATAAFEIKRQALLESIKAAAKKGTSTAGREADLAELEQSKPEAPRLARVLLADETPESLAFSLAKIWPSSAIVSSEGGIVTGGHAMGSDSIMRNLALLNVLWDGGEHSAGRRSKESFTVRNARLTVSLQIQPEALRQFFAKAGTLARGSGFMARFLLAWPASTQGTRLYREPPEHWPALERFNQRIRTILDRPPQIDDDGGLIIPDLDLDPDATICWRQFHDDIEVELKDGGELCDVRDVASKTADNAARIAGLLHVFNGTPGRITGDEMTSGACLAGWYLTESRRFFGEIATPPRIQDAIELDRWLIRYCRAENTRSINRRDIQRHITPSRLRRPEALAAALEELEDQCRVRPIEAGKQKLVQINPKLLGGDRDGLA